eukprot:scaffold9651_cov267-Chaetoceros_neogracile.AAC.10
MSSNGAYARYTANQGGNNPYGQSGYGGAGSGDGGGGYGGGYGSGSAPGYGGASYSGAPTYRGPAAAAHSSNDYAQIAASFFGITINDFFHPQAAPR